MKRMKLVILLMAVVALTGCANKLKCKINTDNYSSTVVVHFKSHKPSTYSFKDKMMFSPLAPEAELYYHSKAEEYSTLIAEKLARMGNNSDNITLKVKYDFNKNNSTQEDKILVGRNDSKNDAKKKIESLGYKCK
ncbi:MAG: hypothetical protein IJL74_01590 [Bacilli bacterium]|nr:hypothetical protein [Bacilli bacterium]